MLQSFFYTVGSLISLYSLLCLVRIVLTWLPDANYSPVGRLLSSACDPFLNWFRRFTFARTTTMDFTPILALGFLSLASRVFMTLGATGKVTIGAILAGVLAILWSFLSFILNILILLLIIRLIYELANPFGFSQFRSILDRFLNPAISRVTGFLFRRQVISYRVSIILTIVVLVIARVALDYGVDSLSRILESIPI